MRSESDVYKFLYSENNDLWTNQVEMRAFPELILNNFKNRNIKILDIGYGKGNDLIYYAQECRHVTGIDIVNFPSKLINRYNNISIINNSFLKETINNKFDLVVDNGCFHHFEPRNVEPYLIKLDSVMKNEGYYAVNTFFSGTSNFRYCDHNRYFRYYLPYEIESIFDSIKLSVTKTYKLKIINSDLYYLSYLFRKKPL